MKAKHAAFKLIFISTFLVFLASCATPSSVISPPSPGYSDSQIGQHPEEIAGLPVHSVESPFLSLLDMAMIYVRQNPEGLRKYFLLDENRQIVLMSEPFELVFPGDEGFGESGIFQINYHIENFRAIDTEGFSGGLLVPYTLRSMSTGESIQDVFFWRPQRDASGILLSFDDNYFDNWISYFDLFDLHNARVTFFVQGNLENTDPTSGENNSAIISFSRNAIERGHDIGFHTINHSDLRWIAIDDFREETINQWEIFADAGINISSFAYPYGFYEDWMHYELFEAFNILRGYGVTYRLYDTGSITTFDNNDSIGETTGTFISSRAIDNILFPDDDEFERAINIMLRTVKFIGGNLILPLSTHQIADNADWGIKPERLSFLLNAANELLLMFYIYSDF